MDYAIIIYLIFCCNNIVPGKVLAFSITFLTSLNFSPKKSDIAVYEMIEQMCNDKFGRYLVIQGCDRSQGCDWFECKNINQRDLTTFDNKHYPRQYQICFSHTFCNMAKPDNIITTASCQILDKILRKITNTSGFFEPTEINNYIGNSSTLDINRIIYTSNINFGIDNYIAMKRTSLVNKETTKTALNRHFKRNLKEASMPNEMNHSFEKCSSKCHIVTKIDLNQDKGRIKSENKNLTNIFREYLANNKSINQNIEDNLITMVESKNIKLFNEYINKLVLFNQNHMQDLIIIIVLENTVNYRNNYEDKVKNTSNKCIEDLITKRKSESTENNMNYNGDQIIIIHFNKNSIINTESLNTNKDKEKDIIIQNNDQDSKTTQKLENKKYFYGMYCTKKIRKANNVKNVNITGSNEDKVNKNYWKEKLINKMSVTQSIKESTVYKNESEIEYVDRTKGRLIMIINFGLCDKFEKYEYLNVIVSECRVEIKKKVSQDWTLSEILIYLFGVTDNRMHRNSRHKREFLSNQRNDREGESKEEYNLSNEESFDNTYRKDIVNMSNNQEDAITYYPLENKKVKNEQHVSDRAFRIVEKKLEKAQPSTQVLIPKKISMRSKKGISNELTSKIMGNDRRNLTKFINPKNNDRNRKYLKYVSRRSHLHSKRSVETDKIHEVDNNSSSEFIFSKENKTEKHYKQKPLLLKSSKYPRNSMQKTNVKKSILGEEQIKPLKAEKLTKLDTNSTNFKIDWKDLMRSNWFEIGLNDSLRRHGLNKTKGNVINQIQPLNFRTSHKNIIDPISTSIFKAFNNVKEDGLIIPPPASNAFYNLPQHFYSRNETVNETVILHRLKWLYTSSVLIPIILTLFSSIIITALVYSLWLWCCRPLLSKARNPGCRVHY